MSEQGMNLHHQQLENTVQYSSYKNTKQPSEQRPPREVEQMQGSSSKASPEPQNSLEVCYSPSQTPNSLSLSVLCIGSVKKDGCSILTSVDDTCKAQPTAVSV